jgi:histidinol phosphatase-like enzyme
MQKKYPIEFAKTFFIGDKWTDVEAARAVGCQPLLIKSRDHESEKYDVPQFSHLQEAVNYILR